MTNSGTRKDSSSLKNNWKKLTTSKSEKRYSKIYRLRCPEVVILTNQVLRMGKLPIMKDDRLMFVEHNPPLLTIDRLIDEWWFHLTYQQAQPQENIKLRNHFDVLLEEEFTDR